MRESLRDAGILVARQLFLSTYDGPWSGYHPWKPSISVRLGTINAHCDFFWRRVLRELRLLEFCVLPFFVM